MRISQQEYERDKEATIARFILVMRLISHHIRRERRRRLRCLPRR